MYNPYQAQVDNDSRNGGRNQQESNINQAPNWSSNSSNNMSNQYQQTQQQTQQQYQQQQQQQQQFQNFNQQSSTHAGFNSGPTPAGHNGTPFNTFFSDPAAQMGLQFSQTAFNASQQYMQHNLGQFVSNKDIKYYFKVSNAYVLKKLVLILFPYKNKSWIRQSIKDSNNDVNNMNNSASEIYATPIDDVNAPDLYIPTMAFLTYILVWALEAGVQGDFHPEMLGYATTRTLAFYIMDFILLRISFYVLGINSRSSKMWDLVSYTGYKFVPILMLLVLEISTGHSITIRYMGLVMLVFSHGFFLMRSLRYVVLPGGGFGGDSKIRMQYLFVYCFVVQGLFIWLMT